LVARAAQRFLAIDAKLRHEEFDKEQRLVKERMLERRRDKEGPKKGQPNARGAAEAAAAGAAAEEGSRGDASDGASGPPRPQPVRAPRGAALSPEVPGGVSGGGVSEGGPAAAPGENLLAVFRPRGLVRSASEGGAAVGGGAAEVRDSVSGNLKFLLGL